MIFSPRAALFGGLLALFACATASAQEPIINGDYNLEGQADDGRTDIEVDLRVEFGPDGELVFVREEDREGPDPVWSGPAAVTVNEDGTVTARVLYNVARQVAAANAAANGNGTTTGIVGVIPGAPQPIQPIAPSNPVPSVPQPQPLEPNQIAAVYTFSADNDGVAETMENLTGFAPEGWTVLQSSGRRDFKGETYGDMAAQLLVPAYVRLEGLLAQFGPETLPHEAKDLRKEIGRVRDFMDIFAYAYPHAGGFDLWEDRREDLDDGYESMGAFKDIFDRQGLEDPTLAVYDAVEVSEARQTVLSWHARFQSRAGLFRAYISDPSKNNVFKRKKDDLSPIYWGGTSIHPQEDDKGLKTIGRLERDLLDEARGDLEELLDTGKITKPNHEERFHDFRKALRGTEKIATYVPQIVDRGEKATELLAKIEETVDRFGLINDRLLALHALDDEADEDAKEALEDEINESWDALKDWMKDQDLDDVLHDMRKRIKD